MFERTYSLKNKPMKVISPYTHIFKTGNKQPLIYNSESNSFIKISETLYKELCSSSFKDISAASMDILLKNRIIVEEGYGDIFYNKERLKDYLIRFNNETLILTIIPTTSCNFNCPYCFEGTKTNHTMTDKTIEDLASFIKKTDKQNE